MLLELRRLLVGGHLDGLLDGRVRLDLEGYLSGVHIAFLGELPDIEYLVL